MFNIVENFKRWIYSTWIHQVYIEINSLRRAITHLQNRDDARRRGITDRTQLCEIMLRELRIMQRQLLTVQNRLDAFHYEVPTEGPQEYHPVAPGVTILATRQEIWNTARHAEDEIEDLARLLGVERDYSRFNPEPQPKPNLWKFKKKGGKK